MPDRANPQRLKRLVISYRPQRARCPGGQPDQPWAYRRPTAGGRLPTICRRPAPACTRSLNATLAQATHMMWIDNFSPLPVVDGLSDLHGVVTWSSIATRYATGQPPTLVEA